MVNRILSRRTGQWEILERREGGDESNASHGGESTGTRSSTCSRMGIALLAMVATESFLYCHASQHEIVYTDETLGLSMSDHARVRALSWFLSLLS